MPAFLPPSALIRLAGLCVAGLLLAGPATAQTLPDADACAFGQVIDLRTGTPASADRLYGQVSTTQLVFLGERPGTPEHAALAACILARKAGARSPVLALQHVTANTQATLDEVRRTGLSDALAFAQAVPWDGATWPPVEAYAPLLGAAVAVRAHILGTDVPPPGAAGTLSADALLEVAPEYGLQTQDILSVWLPDIAAQACTPPDADTALRIAVSRMERDRIIAGRLVAGRTRGPSMLFVGLRETVRRDGAVPWLIARTDRPPSMLVVAAFTQEEWQALAPDGRVPPALATRFDVAVVAGTGAPACTGGG